jgi:transcriptional regulator with XRE-family HTH domain
MTLAEYVEAYIRSHGLSIREFASNCSLSHSAVVAILNNPSYRPDIKTLIKIADYTGVRMVTLLKMTYPEAFKIDENANLNELIIEAFEKSSPDIQAAILRIIGLNRPDDTGKNK